MKMKRVTVEITIDCPLDKNPLKLIRVRQSAMVASLDKKIVKEESIEDKEHPSIQRKAEFFTVRQIIQDGMKKGLKHCSHFRLYGSRNAEKNYYTVAGKFAYWLDWSSTNLDEQRALHGILIALDKGTLTWYRNSNPIKTMSIGDPGIMNTITKYTIALVEEAHKDNLRIEPRPYPW